MDLLSYLVYLFVILSVVMLTQSFFVRKQSTSPSIKELTATQKSSQSKLAPFLKLFHFAIPLNRPIANMLGRDKLVQQIGRAGLRLLPEEYLLVWEAAFIAFYSFMTYIIKTLTGKMDINFSIILVIIGFFIPQIWLKVIGNKRNAMVLRTLPDAIDLVALCVNAGLDFSLAIKWIIDKSKPGPLTEEFSLYLVETRVGKSRRQALKDMAKRVNIPEMNSFARAIAQAERLGAPIEAALNTLAEDIREMRFRKGEKAALLAPLKMLFPLLFFIMPVVAIIVGGPIVLQFISTGFGSTMKNF